jgi:glycosyltransferase involved in cell wall biosynthesis
MPSRLARAAGASLPDIIHVNGLDFGRHISALCRVGPPVLVQDHASRAEARGAWRRRGLRGISGAAFTAKAQAEPFVAKGWFRTDMPVFAVPESSTRFCTGNREEARARCGIYGDPAVLWVGRLDANKDPMTILRAIEIATRALPGLQLWCCFDDRPEHSPLLPEICGRIALSPELPGRVHLLGQVPHADVEMLCRAADFFMLGSHHEGSGYALIEAIACGATPIVSDIPSFRQLTAGGSVGALVPAGDSGLFARALVDLAGCDRTALRERTIGHFIRTLSFDKVGAQLCDIYAALIEGQR